MISKIAVLKGAFIVKREMRTGRCGLLGKRGTGKSEYGIVAEVNKQQKLSEDLKAI